ncbi:MAG: NosD domain-containing protein, partial [Candidatus Thermoplasmatota archaeon]|nr:NosD domain-containing protein [Candidatus Thermoplasmatota archaeon]
RVVDRFGAPVDVFVVVFSNVQANITNYTWGERGWYEYDLDGLDIVVGAVVELASSDGNCIYNHTFVYEGVAVRHDFVLHPDGPEPPGLPPTWDMDGFDDYDGFGHPDDFFDPDNMLDPDNMFSDDVLQPVFKPDLRVLDVWVEPSRVVQDEIVVVSALVTTTSLFFDTYEVAFYLDEVDNETMFGSVLVQPEPGKVTRTVSMSLDTSALEGLHSAIVVVDPDDLVNETDETNNMLSTGFVVLTVEYLSGVSGETIAMLRDIVDSTGLHHSRKRVLNNHLDNVERALERSENFYGRGMDANAVIQANQAVHHLFLFMDNVNDYYNGGEIDGVVYETLIQTAVNLARHILEVPHAILGSEESGVVLLSENNMLDALCLGYLEQPDSTEWKGVADELVDALECYQKAMEKLAKNQDYNGLLDEADLLLEDASAMLEDYMEDGLLDPLFVEPVLAILWGTRLVFPPNLGVSYTHSTGVHYANKPITLEFDIANTGATTARNTLVHVYAEQVGKYDATRDILAREEKNLIAAYTLDDMGRNSEIRLVLEWTPPVAGTYYLIINIDPKGVLPEEDRTTNTELHGVHILGGTIQWDPGHTIPAGVTETYYDSDIDVLFGDVVVYGKLVLVNTNLSLMSELDDPPLRVVVEEGGVLELREDSLVTPQSSGLPFKFEVHGRLGVSNSIVQWTWGNTITGEEGGIQFHPGSMGYISHDSMVRGGATHNIYANAASVHVDSSKLYESGWHNVYAKAGSGAIVTDTNVQLSAKDGLHMVDSLGLVRGATIQDFTETGISLTGTGGEAKTAWFANYTMEHTHTYPTNGGDAYVNVSLPADATVSSASLWLSPQNGEHPNSLELYVGETLAWSMPGELATPTQVTGLAPFLNNYLGIYGNNGWTLVPIRITSPASGNLRIYDLNINWTTVPTVTGATVSGGDTGIHGHGTFAVRNTNITGQIGYGIYGVGEVGEFLSVVNATVENSMIGVYAQEMVVDIRDSVFRGHENIAVYLEGSSVLLDNNTVEHNWAGLWRENAGEDMVSNNSFGNNLLAGMVYYQSDGVRIERNNVSHSQTGILLFKTPGSVVSNNSVNNCYGMEMEDIAVGGLHTYGSLEDIREPSRYHVFVEDPLNTEAILSFSELGSVLRARPVILTDMLLEEGVIVGDELAFDLFDNMNYTAIVDWVSVDVNGVSTVRARIHDYFFGYVLISTKDGRSLGTISIPERNESYQILYESETDTHFLAEMDTRADDLVGQEDVLMPSESEQEFVYSAIDNILSLNDPYAPANIDIMVVYTPAAKEWSDTNGGGIENVIATAMARGQLVLDNSRTYLTMTLVHSAEVDYIESSDRETHLQRLRDKDDGYMDIVHDWRDTYGADLVALLFRGTGGYAYLSPAQGKPESGFSVTGDVSALNNFAFIHELGHNLGCHHHKEQTTQPGPGAFSYSAGWAWTGMDSNTYTSVMTYPLGLGPNVAHFSNPDVLHEGVPTGDHIDGDNARTIREMKHVVAAYRGGETIAGVGVYLYDSEYSSVIGNNISSADVSVFSYRSHSCGVMENVVGLSTYGLVFYHSNKLNVTGNTAGLSEYGIVFHQSDKNNVTGNTMVLNYASGMHLSSASECEVENNAFINNIFGISFFNSDNNTVKNNNISSNTRGIYLISSENNNITYNIIDGNNQGIRLYSSNNTFVNDNDIWWNLYGLYAVKSDLCDASMNTIRQNWWGLVVEETSSMSVKENDIIHNRNGMFVNNSSILIMGNNVAGTGPYRDEKQPTFAHLQRYGVYLRDSICEIAYNLVDGNYYGVYIENATGKIHNNTLNNHAYMSRQRGGAQAMLYSYSGAGIWLNRSSGIGIFDNSLTGNYHAVRLEDSSPQIYNNTFERNNDMYLLSSLRLFDPDTGWWGEWEHYYGYLGTGILGYMTHEGGGANEPMIINNFFDTNRNDMYLVNASGILIGNTFITSRILMPEQTPLYALKLISCMDMKVEWNNISDRKNGIYIQDSTTVRITQNIISENNNGIVLNGSSGNSIYHNSFIDNTVQALDDGTNIWDLGYEVGGNYWSDHNSPDGYSGPNQDVLGADGIVDQAGGGLNPQLIAGGGNQDMYPFATEFGWLRVFNVERDVWHRSIQLAVDYAQPGNTLLATSGIYYENVVIDKPVALVGEDASTTIIDGGGSGTTITVTANDVKMNGFTIIGGGSGLQDATVYLYAVQGCNFQKNNISSVGEGHGVRLWNSNLNFFENNTINNAGFGIYLWNSQRNTFANNTVTENDYGISFRSGSNNNTVSYSNTFLNNGAGIYIASSKHNLVQHNNIFKNNNYSIYLVEADHNMILYNNVSFNNLYGITIGNSHWNIVMGNNVTNNQRGIWITGSSSHTKISENTIFANEEYGVYLDSATNDNLVYHNNFMANTIHAYDLGDNTWNLSYGDGGGNYWSDWTSPDVNNDGFVDLPRSVPDGENEDMWPHTIPYGWLYEHPLQRVFNLNQELWYGSIQSAVDHAQPGEMIQANEGIYYENVIINKTLTIVGNGTADTVIVDLWGSEVLQVRANWVNISGFTVQASAGFAGITIVDSQNYHIESIQVSSTYYAIHMKNSSNGTLTNNTMSSGGIFISGNAVHNWNTHNIDTTNILNSKAVIYWKDQTDDIVSGDVGQIILANCTNVRVENMSIINGSIGILLGFSSNNTVTGNIVSGNSNGIHLYSSSNNILSNNNASDNWNGIHLDGASNNTVTGNIVSGNSNGIHLYSSSNN